MLNYSQHNWVLTKKSTIGKILFFFFLYRIFSFLLFTALKGTHVPAFSTPLRKKETEKIKFQKDLSNSWSWLCTLSKFEAYNINITLYYNRERYIEIHMGVNYLDMNTHTYIHYGFSSLQRKWTRNSWLFRH